MNIGCILISSTLVIFETNIPPSPSILGANILDLFQETPELRDIFLTVLLLCRIGSTKTGLYLFVTLPKEKARRKEPPDNILREVVTLSRKGHQGHKNNIY